MLDFFETLNSLSQIPSPTGDERALAAKIAELARPFADEIKTDALGNLIISKTGLGERVMIAAHMDTIGLVATHYDDNGFIRFGALGGLDSSVLSGTEIILSNVHGVISCDAKVEAKDRKLKHFYIDIGAADADDARALAPLGTTAVFAGRPTKLGEHRICAPYLDNRVGVVILLMLISALPESDYDMHFVFTVQEEVGMRGARTAAFAIEPKFALSLDVTDVGDTPESEFLMETKLGGGAAIKIMDSSVVCHPKITGALQQLAAKIGIPFQNEIMTDGGTDAGAIHLSNSGVLTGGISIPTRYIHSPREVCDVRDVNAAVALLQNAIEQKVFF
ncbi:MAG: M20/M25/M40 family metallo-hydrolase [Clostridia bacterium]